MPDGFAVTRTSFWRSQACPSLRPPCHLREASRCSAQTERQSCGTMIVLSHKHLLWPHFFRAEGAVAATFQVACLYVRRCPVRRERWVPCCGPHHPQQRSRASKPLAAAAPMLEQECDSLVNREIFRRKQKVSSDHEEHKLAPKLPICTSSAMSMQESAYQQITRRLRLPMRWRPYRGRHSRRAPHIGERVS